MASASVRLQLAYNFQDNTVHSMDAFLRNDNEKEVLIIMRELASALQIAIEIESEAIQEGSLVNFWKFIGDNEKQIKMCAGALIFIFSLPYGYQQFRNVQLDNQIKELEIIKRTEEAEKLKREALNADSVMMSQLVERAVQLVQDDIKIHVHKSHFYKRLITERKVTHITATEIDERSLPVGSEKRIDKIDFPKFILKSNNLEPLVDDEALIEIIAPILKAGDFSWKGIYQNEQINFKILDQKFKGSVLAGEYTFANGDSIRCVLQQKRQVDDLGVIRVIERNVLLVIEKVNSTEPAIITPQGQRHRAKKKQTGNQLSFF
ncbi:MAG TPA: hypothetical protein VD927_11370 [Chryseosolibacter sp.]|nr:hypothetical protein [Chryseosolibacter sp.]